jgi:hypothetical protein
MMARTMMNKLTLTMAIVFALASGAVGCRKDQPQETPDTGVDAGDQDAAQGCDDGELGCACFADGSCKDGLSCVDAVCVSPELVGLRIDAPNARACDVLLQDTQSTSVHSARFAPDVQGHSMRMGDRTALSFINLTDETFADGSVLIEILGTDPQEVRILRTQCADKNGATLTSATIELR